MKTRLVLLAVLLAAVVTGSAFAQSRTRTSDSVSRTRRDDNSATAVVSSSRTRTSDFVLGHRGYRYRDYNYGGRYRYYGYGDRYEDEDYGYYRYYNGSSASLAVLGGAAAIALGGPTPQMWMWGPVALGWLLGKHLDEKKAERPLELVEWYEDSEGNRSWEKSGAQIKVGRPKWVGQPPAAPPTTVAPSDQTPSPSDSVRSATPSLSESNKKLEAELNELHIQIKNVEKTKELKKQIYLARKRLNQLEKP